MLEFFGRGPAGNGGVVGGGLQILADGDDVHAGGAEVAEGLGNLVLLLAEAEHDAGFRHKAAALRVAQEVERAVVARGFADGALEPFDRFEVVVEDVGLGVEDGVEGFGLAAKIGDEDFDGGLGIAVADGANGGGPDAGATIEQVVAGDGGDDGVAETHFGDGIGDTGGFAEIEFGGAPGLHGAEGAGTRADVAQDHDGRGAAGPAFTHVGALGGLADGVQVMVVHQLAGFAVAGAGGKLGAEPVGLAGGGGHDGGIIEETEGKGEEKRGTGRNA